MPGVEVALHGGHGVTHQAERHVAVGRRLVLDEHVNIAVAGGGFQAVKHVAVVGVRLEFGNYPTLSVSSIRGDFFPVSASP